MQKKIYLTNCEKDTFSFYFYNCHYFFAHYFFYLLLYCYFIRMVFQNHLLFSDFVVYITHHKVFDWWVEIVRIMNQIHLCFHKPSCYLVSFLSSCSFRLCEVGGHLVFNIGLW